MDTLSEQQGEGLLYRIQALVAAVFVPFILLNSVGWGVAVVWLAIQGNWGLLAAGIGAAIIGPFLISLGMLPAMGLALLGVQLLEGRAKAAGYLLLAAQYVWTLGVMAVWGAGSFVFVTPDWQPDIPHALWAYAIATGPLIYMAQKESQSDPSSFAPIGAFFQQIAALVAMGLILSQGDTLGWSGFLWCFGLILGFGTLVQILLAFNAHRPASPESY